MMENTDCTDSLTNKTKPLFKLIASPFVTLGFAEWDKGQGKSTILVSGHPWSHHSAAVALSLCSFYFVYWVFFKWKMLPAVRSLINYYVEHNKTNVENH